MNMHMHTTPLRRDDMESLAYSIADLVRKGLPWDRLESEDVFAAKQSWSGPNICAGYPAVFGAFIDHTRSLDF
ncbi:uncharacterized protein SCHCODRAFT_01198204 [Schizophyllum commune H4-8]|uniref:uncharacterized protein n=1 Tax=Schizophyllum commune (strain H4-8 / FGSC 9210) TaxID=578458 RepID=UPI00215EE8DD|nr:uncharacterized protein SCHCODRAFT_01198204 [Schizophyllum commune H4-8]KAI5899221.1 hypothetical protein SCHCODRAFT_01198204 [Schizophyllum commune H4-8]